MPNPKTGVVSFIQPTISPYLKQGFTDLLLKFGGLTGLAARPTAATGDSTAVTAAAVPSTHRAAVTKNILKILGKANPGGEKAYNKALQAGFRNFGCQRRRCGRWQLRVV